MKGRFEMLFTIFTSKLLAIFIFTFGFFWFLSLSQNELSYATYMSENALLVGLIKNRFSNSASIEKFYNEINNIENDAQMFEWLTKKLDEIGLDVGIQNFTFSHDKSMKGQVFYGHNVYGILRSPGASRSQALLVTIPLRNGKDSWLKGSIAMILALAQQSRYEIFWAMDVIFLFTEMEYIGLKSWLDAYHGVIDKTEFIQSNELNVRSGSILAGFNVEIQSSDVSYVEFKMEGLNGGLPNLDLYNTAVRLGMGNNVPVRMNGIKPNKHGGGGGSLLGRSQNLRKLLSMMWQLASGSPSGLHGLMISQYQIPSVTLKTHFSRQRGTTLYHVTQLTESLLRCLNSLQERFHQSFFFYLLPDLLFYVSIGVYMIPFGVMIVGGLIGGIVDGLYSLNVAQKKMESATAEDKKIIKLECTKLNLVFQAISQLIILGFAVGLSCRMALDYFLTNSSRFAVEADLALLIGAAAIVIGIIFFCRIQRYKLNSNSIKLVKAIIMLITALFIGTLSVLNISLAFFISLILVPNVILIQPYNNKFLRALSYLFMSIISNPLSVLYMAAWFHMFYFQNKSLSNTSFVQFHNEILNLLKQWFIQAWIERDVLGSWTVDIICFGYLPIWTALWAFLKLPASY